MTKTILILGASYTGLNITHKLLKKTLNNSTEYKIVLVAPNTHHYWNLATVRAVVPGQIADEKIFADIRPGFKQYPESKFEFIHGAATALDPTSKTVKISKSESGETISQSYDILIICTGSRYEGGVPWKGSLNGFEATKETLHATQAKVKAAKSIVIGGGGSAGVEVSGELGFEYGLSKEITLVTAGKTLIIPDIPPAVHKAAENELKKLHVSIIYDTKVESAQEVNGKYELTLSNGEKKTVDLYLPTTGITLNTEFVPKELLNAKGEIKTDQFLRIKDVKDVWAAGDVTDLESSQLPIADKQAEHLVHNLDLVIKGGSPTEYKLQPPMIAVTLGRSKATGRMNSWKLPSIMIWYIKGRTFFTEKQAGLVSGASA